ncbi:MAG: hypothetical protein LLG37_00930 [Spirochaetia bacterium]|nr:hypothetical protein [Spirochaetia bacterium]
MDRKTTFFVLCRPGFIGLGETHRFYEGIIRTGLLWPATAGLYRGGTVIDVITIGTGSFK